MKSELFLLAVILFLNSIFIMGQEKFTDEYLKGIGSLSRNLQEEAETYFKSSIMKNKDAGSFYRLARLQLDKNTFNSRNESLENLKQASLREPENIEYRLAYASLLEEFAKQSALNEYMRIIKEYPWCAKAIVRLGNMKLAEYNEYKNSKKIGDESDPSLDFDLSAEVKNDYAEAEKFFLQALEIDSLDNDAFYGLSRLYENSGNEKKAIGFLNEIVQINPANKDAHLFLGMLYHQLGKAGKAGDEFAKALNLMSSFEREDFVYNSVVMLLKPIYEQQMEKLTKKEIESAIERFWKVSNPLLLSDINERLLEHYSRMAYANMYYSIPAKGIEGWKTDRGEVLIRYGIPKMKSRTRPLLTGGGTFYAKNDIWMYNGFSLTFDDYSMNGNYKLTWERAPGRFNSSPRSNPMSFNLFEKMKKETIQIYEPKGKQFNINKEIFCFKSLTDNRSGVYDAYLVYELPLQAGGSEYETGIYLFDRNFHPLLEKRSYLKKEKIEKLLSANENQDKIDNIKFSIPRDSVSFAFEMRNLSDSSFYSYHSLVKGAGIKEHGFDISDVVFASLIDNNKATSGTFKRNELFVLPKISRAFQNNETVFLYYEIYDLLKDKEGFTDFEQIITLEVHNDKEPEGGISSVFKGIKNFLFGPGNKISMSSSYKTNEENQQQYIQLDFSRQTAGMYDLILEVKDKVSGEKINKKITIEIVDQKNQ